VKYRFTVWNTLIIVLIPVISYILLRQNDFAPNSVLGAGLLIPVVIVGATIDLILQVIVKNNKVLAVLETSLLIIIIIVNNMR